MRTIEKLQRVQEMLGTKDVNAVFYAITLRESCLHLQGKINSEDALVVANKLGIELVFEQNNGWLKGEKDGIEMCLTM